MKYIPNKVDDLKDMLKKTDFKSPDVEDFIFSLDAEEINSFKKRNRLNNLYKNKNYFITKIKARYDWENFDFSN